MKGTRIVVMGDRVSDAPNLPDLTNFVYYIRLHLVQYMNLKKHSNKQAVTANAKSKTGDIIK